MGSNVKVYQRTGTALLRAAAVPLSKSPSSWPDPDDTEAARMWLREIGQRPEFAEAIAQASDSLAARLNTICDGNSVRPRQVRRAYLATVSYVLRATGRPTPFGLFAGVAAAAIGRTPRAQWGDAHRAVIRPDTEWLEDVINDLEAIPDLLDRLNVVLNSLAMQRGSRLHVQHGGPSGAAIRRTPAVRAIEASAARPLSFTALITAMEDAFPGTDTNRMRAVLSSLLQQKFLISSLRAPMTETDPLGHLIAQLHAADATSIESAAVILHGLEAVRRAVREHNDAPAGLQEIFREAAARQCRKLSDAARSPVAVDLVVDADVQIPGCVVRQMEQAADVLLRLTRRPAGQGVWLEYHAAFWERYGTGTLVPVKDVVDPVGGLGYPAEYPGSRMLAPKDAVSERDERLLALAWQASFTGSREIMLTDTLIDQVAEERPTEREAPPHVEMCARIHSESVAALERGEFTVAVTPARSAGTLTSRFTPVATGSGLEKVYRQVPPGVEGAITAQLSFPGLYAHTENVSRIPAYLPYVISLGEHRLVDDTKGTDLIDIDDLAVTATSSRLYLVSISRRTVVDPQVFHAMALDKQPPPLARFLAHLTRAFGPAWTGFGWGPLAERLPFLPRVRYDKATLSPARWYLPADALPPRGTDAEHWEEALAAWRKTWQCQDTVELRDDDRALRLQLDVPAHAAILREHLDRNGHAVLTEAPPEEGFGWLGGRVHEVALPLLSTRPASPNPLRGLLPVQRNRMFGQFPSSPSALWLSVWFYTHPDQHDDLIANHLAVLAGQLPHTPRWWFVRYRSPHRPDHIRMRIRIRRPSQRSCYTAAVGSWGTVLRRAGLISDLSLNTYSPEVGRYGTGQAMLDAETVFVADSQFVVHALRDAGTSEVEGQALVATGMVDIARGLLGPNEGLRWLAERPVQASAAERSVSDQAVELARSGTPAARGWDAELAAAWHSRAEALALYGERLDGMDMNGILESLLHMHHNRLRGVDRHDERACRRIARQAALACLAWPGAAI
ncbi:thiopeptide-type bacteriocin biosynthesis protein [Streptomyces sp. NPDC007991]|uniref:lantibiotic dehydratase n=1 Tax=Streptomyces sp. NPDC007991 TaxID=3364803 RepID=UPI0036E9687B